MIDVRNLVEAPWTPETLRPFFGELTVSEWFNPSAPDVKSGAVAPAAMTEAEALAALCASPILIRRPLMVADGACRAGLDAKEVRGWIGLREDDGGVTHTCSKPDKAAACHEP